MRVLKIAVLLVIMSVMSTVFAADDCNIVRYVDNLDGTMTDCRSNLIWLKDTNCKKHVKWHFKRHRKS